MRIRQRLERLEAQQPSEDHGIPFLFFPSFHTYDEALAFAKLTDHDGPVFPVQVIGLEPEPN